MNRNLRWLIFIILVLILAIWINTPNNPGKEFLNIQRSFDTRFGLDLVGGVQALLEADLPDDTQITAEALQTARTIVENRVNGLGVNEAVVQLAGDRRIVVELPGETDPEKALETIKQTGLLEFVDFSSLAVEQAINLVGSRIETDFATASETQATSLVTGTVSSQVFHTVMTGAALKTVQVTADQLSNEPQVAFELTPEGTQIFRDYTSSNIGQVLAIVLDKQVISAPTIRNAITDGQGVISGQFTLESANALAVQLRYGSLPIPLKIVESRTVGPTLGQDSLNKSIIAGVIGFSVVILFMILYYRLPGIVAILTILLYALVTFAIYRSIPITLTLPGIAGFLLSTGSALDANILIFERLKEELRAGRTLGQAVDLGWRRAWPSIRDSNIATIITSTILFWFGSAFGATIVKGFSLTLAIGVGVSLFTALLVTRTILGMVLEFFKPSDQELWFGI
ncbi:MAG: protein translocase subunit SecD [Anaerolineales bacterium]|nr:MAG: protein translocase subunit SecD [Anaerolineales bacterium]